MTHIIGVRRPGAGRLIFAKTNYLFPAGETVRIESSTESFAATVIVAADQLPEPIPPVEIAGTASPVAESPDHSREAQSVEDERYRARKARFPELGELLPDGVVVRVDLRHGTFDLRDERGEIRTISLQDSDNPD